MQIDEIIRRVKAEAGKSSTLPPHEHPGAEVADRGPALEIRDRYHVRDFLAIDSAALVDTVYRCLLGRAPDPLAEAYRQKLATGRLTPVAFIGRIRFSAEGRRRGTRVDGLLPRLVFGSLKENLLIGYLCDLWVTFFRMPQIERDLTEHIRLLRAELLQKADRSEIIDKTDRADLDRKADRSEVSAYREAVRYAELYFHGVNEQLQTLLLALKNQLPDSAAAGPVATQVAALSAGAYDKLYLDFESLYRGTRQQVADALTAYADLLAPPGGSSAPSPVAIDLGCGRGEMVRYLGQLGYAAAGVDLNRVAVDSCLAEDLQAVHADALTYLDGVAPGSVPLITSMHLVEHLSHEDLFRLLQAALKALSPGGMLLLETPNPRNLLVGAGDFYRDFTHVKPLFPDTLRFLLDYFGYEDAGIFYFEEVPGQGRRLIPAGNIRFDDLDDYLRVSRDYAVVGYQRCG